MDIILSGDPANIREDNCVPQGQQDMELSSELQNHLPTGLSTEDLRDIWNWNATVPQASDVLVHDRIAEIARNQPDSIAVCAWDGEWTYCEVEALSTRLALYLVTLGVRSILPLCFEKSKWTAIAMLAVMKAGGASLALDPSHPKKRLQRVLEQVKPTMMLASLATAGLATQLAQCRVVIVNDSTLAELAPPLEGVALPTIGASSLLYCVFTSGSTGNPKGVLITHSNFSSAIQHQQEWYGFGISSRVYDFASYAFDAAWLNLLATLSCGGCLCVPSEADRTNDLAGSMRRLRATHVDLTPSVTRLLSKDTLNQLHTLIVAGEVLHPEDAKRWADMVNLKNVYGPCECTPTATIAEVEAGTASEGSVIGRGVGACTWIVNSRGELAPIGSIGELLLEGPIVGPGYLEDPDRTAAAFIEDPPWLLRGNPEHLGRHGRLYKTGDLVRYNANGSLIFIGRADTRVKINGQLVELADVENAIQGTLLDIATSAVVNVATPTQHSKELMVAFLEIGEIRMAELAVPCGQDEFQRLTFQIDERLAEKYPAYMIPSVYMPVATFPISATGKTDRWRLREMVEKLTYEQLLALTHSHRNRKLPTSSMERQLQKLWSSVLDIDTDSISADDSFLRIGGDSIGAMTLVAAAREQGLYLTVAAVMQHPRLSDLATFTRSTDPLEHQTVQPFSLLRWTDNIREQLASLCNVATSQIQDAFPCTPLQEGLLALTARRAGDYITEHVLELRETLDVARFQEAWGKVFAKTPILRTRIVDLPEQGLVQVVLDEQIEWLSRDTIDNETTDKEQELGLGTTLVHFEIVNEPEGRCFFIWSMHHALFDGWSIPIILEHLNQAYSGETWEPGPAFQEFVRYTTNIDRSQARTFWERQLQDLEAPIFPALPENHSQGSCTSVTHQIEGLSWPETDVTPSNTIRAAWALFLSQYTNSRDVVFGVTSTGRQATIPGVEGMTGPTIATMPLRVRVNQGISVDTFLAQIQTQAVEMTPFEQVGIQNIRRFSIDAERACQFQSLLIVQPRARGPEHSPLFSQVNDEGSEESKMNGVFSTYAINLTCQLQSDGVELRVDFNSHVLEASQIMRIIKHMEQALRQLCADENSHILLSALGTVTEKDLLDIWTWNAQPPEASNIPVHHLIAKTVRSQPDSVAVCAWDGEWTYGELDLLSTRLAYFLVTFQANMVPLCFEKSKWMPLAMLAVMKAGKTSVALDPNQPEAHLRTIMKQVTPTLILSSSQHFELASRLGDVSVVVVDWAGFARTDIVRTSDNAPRPALPVVRPSDPLYLIFTSGTTGEPKGVLITHGNLSSAVHHQKGYMYKKASRVLDFASYAFDVAWSNFINSLVAGACLCIPCEEDRKNDLAKSIHRFRTTHIDLTPSTASVLPDETIQSLETLILGGELLSSQKAQKWRALTTIRDLYGPSECTPTTMIALHEADTAEGNIGRGVGVCTWITGADGELVPIGGVGELLLEGPLVGPGYLDAEKTAVAYIDDPAWLLRGGPWLDQVGRKGRLYKTGDLVRYNADGTLTLIGRKDMRVKINGQLVELAAVEHHIQRYKHIRQCACLLPNRGIYAKRLVGILTLHGFQGTIRESPDIQLLPDPGDDSVNYHIHNVRQLLDSALPSYMVPGIWIAVRDIPLTTSGKLNRNALLTWLSTAEELRYHATDAERIHQAAAKRTDIECILYDACSYVLDVPVARIDSQRSFVANGGDSISAMRLVPRCRAVNIAVSVAALLQSRSLAELAGTLSTGRGAVLCAAQEFDRPFALSPIQRWFFAHLHPGDTGLPNYYYNQSFCVELRSRVSSDQMAEAVNQMVELHSMLKARFWREKGVWKQRIPSSNANMYSFRTQQVLNLKSIEILADERQRQIDIEKGPVFMVDLCEQPDGTQYLFLIAHHLVVDLVSWRIILDDLETLLTSGTLLPCLPFQTWNELQIEKAHTLVPPKLSTNGAVNDTDFWGYGHLSSNTRRDHDYRFIDIDRDMTSLLLGSATQAFQSEPVDLILSAVWDAFFHVFPERHCLSIWIEGHGREPWIPEIDLSRTVGWFTTIVPITVSRSAVNDHAGLVKVVKDARRRLPANGWACFTSKQLNPEGNKTLQHEDPPAEVEFNYHGQFQQLERDDSLFDLVPLNVADDGADLPTARLFGLEVFVQQGQAQIAASWNRNVAHQDRIQAWFSRIKSSLDMLCNAMVATQLSKAVSDYPFLDIGHDRLGELQRHLTHVGFLNNAKVVEVVPCSPTVTGMLLSQTKQSGLYNTCEVYELTALDITTTRLAVAWQKVIAHQPTLRSVFTSALDRTATFHQMILENFRGEVVHIDCPDEAAALEQLRTLRLLDYQQLKPPHRLSLCQTSGKIICQIEMSHAITDGASTALILQDWSDAYHGTLLAFDLLSTCRGVAQTFASANTLDYWQIKLAGSRPCHFPRLSADLDQDEQFIVSLKIPGAVLHELQKLIQELSITLASMFQAAWALTLASYAGTESVCFGYLASGRDLPVAGLDRYIGALANMLVFRADDFSLENPRTFVQATYSQMVQDLQFQHCSLAAIQHALDIPNGQPLFNSSLNCQTADNHTACSEEMKRSQLAFQNIDGKDPTEVSLILFR